MFLFKRYCLDSSMTLQRTICRAARSVGGRDLDPDLESKWDLGLEGRTHAIKTNLNSMRKIACIMVIATLLVGMHLAAVI